jgi:hypothetical protein
MKARLVRTCTGPRPLDGVGGRLRRLRWCGHFIADLGFTPERDQAAVRADALDALTKARWMISVRDVLTEDEWLDVRIRMPTPFELVRSKRKLRKTGRYQEGIRFLPVGAGTIQGRQEAPHWMPLPKLDG